MHWIVHLRYSGTTSIAPDIILKVLWTAGNKKYYKLQNMQVESTKSFYLANLGPTLFNQDDIIVILSLKFKYSSD